MDQASKELSSVAENAASRNLPGVRGSLYTDSTAPGRMQKYILWVQRKAQVRDRGKQGSGNGCSSSVGPRGTKRWELEGTAWGEGEAMCTRAWGPRGGGEGPPSGPESW